MEGKKEEMKKYYICTAALIAATSALGQLTNQTAASDNTIIVSATRIDTPIEQIGSSVSVVSSDEISSMNAKNAQDALRQVPGVQFTQNGGPGTASSVMIRGANANHTLVLVNGIRVNSNTTGSFNLSQLPTESIDRIEVLRGPQSALYGGDSIGGVVNIVTKKGIEGFGGNVLIERGGKGYLNTAAGIFGGNGIFDFAANISYNELEEYDIAKNYGGNEYDPYKQMSIYTDLGLNFANDGRMDWIFMYNGSENDLDQSGPWPAYWQVDDLDRSTERDFYLTSVEVSKPITDMYEQSIKIGTSSSRTTGKNDGQAEYEYENNNVDFNAQSDLYLHERDILTLGYDYRYSEAENIGSIPMTHRNQNSFYANNNFSLKERWYLDLGARYDDYSDYDGKGTWQAKTSWQIVDSSRLHSSLGTGYKVPTFNDLYWPDTGWTAGNPDVQPEKSKSFDLGLEQAFAKRIVVADVTGFYSEIEDLIAWAPNSSGTWIPSNVNNADIWGVETSLSYTPIDTFSTKVYYTYTSAEDADTGLQLARRAEHTAGLFMSSGYLEFVDINLDIAYVGDRYDNAGNTRSLDPYTLIHLGFVFHVIDELDMMFNINNLTDEDYETAAGYSTVGRVVSAGFNYKF